MYLPYWDSDLDVEVGPWGAVSPKSGPLFSSGLNPLMARIAAGALAMESEFLYLCGLVTGVAGTMAWEDPLTAGKPQGHLSLFTVVFGYSRHMETLLASFLESHSELRGGITDCTFWRKEVPLSHYKVIALIALLPLIDEGACLRALAEAVDHKKDDQSLIAYYAEKLGYLRGPVPYETDNPRGLSVTAELLSLQLEATWEVLGPSPVTALPVLSDFSGALTLSE